MFKALMVRKEGDQQVAAVETLDDESLSDGNVTVAVEYSSFNYKDGLAITGAAPILATLPMIPGIDLAGTVLESSDDRWQPGARVLINGYGIGERHNGGYAERARVQSDWLVAIPAAFDARQAMAIGTAGYTAMLCVQRIERLGAEPGNGPVLVTGASGGVGSIAIALLGQRGYEVIASTGRTAETDYLKTLGAAEVMDRAELAEASRPLQAERWQAAIDTAGSHTLVNVLAGTRYGGAVAATGLAQGIDLPASMYPFILRDVTLSGVDSVMQAQPPRQAAWDRLATDLDPKLLEQTISEVGLEELPALAPKILAGQVRGRTVVGVGG